MTANVYETQARMMKALQLTAVLRSTGCTVADYDAHGIDWALAARAAGIEPPSVHTKAMVRAMLEAAEGDTPTDPFEAVTR
jgi:hypothetical protein